MSYYIQRIRLADICRTIIDSMPFMEYHSEALNYEEIISLDGKFDTFFKELPFFFRLDKESRLRSREIDLRLPFIRVQRFTVNLVAQSRRCKLNRPFLVRGSLDYRYAYSRETCLRCARALIAGKQLLEKDNAAVSTYFHCLIHHVFLGIVVLAMDLCFNRIEGQEERRRAEVMEACKMLEDAREQSVLAGKFLDSLMDILRKYKIQLLKPPPDHKLQGYSSSLPSPAFVAPPAEARSSGLARPQEMRLLESEQQPRNIESDFDELCQSYTQVGPTFDIPGWDHIFFDLGANVV